MYRLYNKFTLSDLSFQKPMETNTTLLNFFGSLLKSFRATRELESSTKVKIES